MAKLTYEQVKKYIEDLGCKLLSEEYKNTTTPLIIQCECGRIFERKFKILQKSPICKCKKCTQEYLTKGMLKPFEEILFEVEKRGYKILTTENDYKGINKKYKFICSQGHEKEMYLSDLLSGHECKICATEKVVSKLRLSYEKVKDAFEKEGYELLSETYKNSSENLIVKCPKGHVTETMTYGNFKKGARCLKCYNLEVSIRQTISFLERKRIVESFGFEILINENEYINGSIKIPLKCPEGHEFKMCMHDFQQGNRCPYCNESKGEKRISNYLDFNSIKYIKEKRFNDCRGKSKPLPFDFHLSDYNCCIEYDGKQHFHLNSYSFTLLDLMNRKYLDNKKTKYCKDNNIKLIRISYWDFDNIEKILKYELNL